MDKRERIRSLFLDPEESYSLPEVARLTNTHTRALRREVARGGRDAVKVRGRWRFLWRQAAYLAMDRWTLAEIHDALGDDAAAILPPLLSLRAVTVRLPEYLVRALETLAAEDGATLDATLYGELIDFAGATAGHMEAKIPGYRQAYMFPGRNGIHYAFFLVGSSNTLGLKTLSLPGADSRVSRRAGSPTSS